ncbi:hypothetical protein FOL46_000897 [Perkinsus olseni]|uniref:Uncharacterized protein n=1 Tax=Perkinsus olseni TaxID=32597 RepID=A0A7J6MGS7_PEROL|nr:hypothetical protein FOL46_000897 [Perkinsus olseni]
MRLFRLRCITSLSLALTMPHEMEYSRTLAEASSRQFLGSGNYACDLHGDVCSIAVQAVGMKDTDSLIAYGEDGLPKGASSNTLRVPKDDRPLGGTQQLDMPGEEWIFTIEANTLEPGQYSLKVFTASDEISLGALVVADLALGSALPTTRMPSDVGPSTTRMGTPPSSTDPQVTTTTTTQPSNSTNEGSKDNNSLAIYVGLIGGLSGGLLGIVCILIAACAYCGWSARRKGFTELKATDAAIYDGGASARSSVFRRMHPYHHTSAAAAAADGGGGEIDIEDVRSELTLLSLDPIAHLADAQHQGVRLEAMPGETLAPAPSMNGGESMIGTLPRTSSGASLAESTQCSTAVLRDRMDYAQVGALRMAARRALANLVHQSPASEARPHHHTPLVSVMVGRVVKLFICP